MRTEREERLAEMLGQLQEQLITIDTLMRETHTVLVRGYEVLQRAQGALTADHAVLSSPVQPPLDTNAATSLQAPSGPGAEMRQ